MSDRLREAARAAIDYLRGYAEQDRIHGWNKAADGTEALIARLCAALDAEPEPSPTETIAWTESIHGDRIEMDVPSPTNEERARKNHPGLVW